MGAVGGSWDAGLTGVLELPSGRLVRGRSLRESAGNPPPEFGLYLLARPPAGIAWPCGWVRWPDFGLPADPERLHHALREVWERAGSQRVEIACRGGTGRTGTALACLAVLDGVPPPQAVAFVQAGYRPHAVETPRQRAFVIGFRP